MESGQNHYQPLMLIFLAAMTGFCFTADLFNLFVFFELMSTAAFALWTTIEEPAPLQGSFNFAVTNTVGAFFTLTGIGLLYGVTGALNMAQMGWLLGSRHDSLVLTACLFIITGFLIKAAIVPFHFWLPDAHSVAPTPVCVLFSGIMVELGLFAILRVTTVVFGSSFSGIADPLRVSFLALGGITAVWGGVMSFAEHHLKRVLAFSTISHSGVLLVAVGLGSRMAIAGWLIYVCAHAMIKSGLFFTSGILLHRLRTMSEPLLFGRGRKLKFTAGLWLLGACGLAGLPPFATALAEDMVTHSNGDHTSFMIMIPFLIAGILTAGAVLRIFMRVFCGWGDKGPSDRSSQIDELPETLEENCVIPFRLFGPAFICIASGILLMFLPSVKALSLGAYFSLSFAIRIYRDNLFDPVQNRKICCSDYGKFPHYARSWRRLLSMCLHPGSMGCLSSPGLAAVALAIAPGRPDELGSPTAKWSGWGLCDLDNGWSRSSRWHLLYRAMKV